MDRAKLLILLGEAWESDDMRQTLTNGLIGTWANAADQKALLNYDWAPAPGEQAYITPLIKLKSTKSGRRRSSCQACAEIGRSRWRPSGTWRLSTATP